MIALALLALVLQETPAPGEEADIVVIGKRLEGVSVIVGRDARGKFTCGLNQSTGHSGLDASLCRTAAACVRTRAKNVQACVNTRKPELLADVRQSMGARR